MTTRAGLVYPSSTMNGRFPKTCSTALAAALGVSACSGNGNGQGNEDFEQAWQGIDAARISAHTERLASDEFGGRAPASPGEALTLDYLVAAFEEYGLQPGTPEGFLQSVPMVEIEPDYDMALQIGDEVLGFGDEFVAWTRRLVEEVGLYESELVFAGYGIVAPEYGWNDYEGIDWAGKTAVVLVNDPGYATQDPELFTGRAMTYYGRWTYKYEEAARQGAAGLLIIHEDGPAGYGWNVVENSWSVPQYDLSERGDERHLAVEGWITREVAERLVGRAGTSLEALKNRALSPDFQPMPLADAASIEISNTIDTLTSYNVVATLPGTDRPQEQILYTAHWDHLGTDPNLEGDNIYNGAVDNAMGTAALIEIARAFSTLEEPLERSVSFLAVTAEEKGLLGSLHYSRSDALQPANTVATLNMDTMVFGSTTPSMTVIGLDRSQLGERAANATERQGRDVMPNPSPEAGYFYRSDHLNFVRLGIPSLALLSAGSPDSDYVQDDYHQTSDEFDPQWSFEGAVADAQVFFQIGYELADSGDWPAWSPDSEFQREQ